MQAVRSRLVRLVPVLVMVTFATFGMVRLLPGDPARGFLGPDAPQEHVDLLKSITSGNPLNEGRQVAESCMAAIMGRISAYTGQMVRWSEVMTQQGSPHYNLKLAPSADDFEKGDVKCPEEETAPVAGK